MQDGIANKTPSVVVFAAHRVPATVVNDSSDAALLRQYLNAGGKVVFLGRRRWPINAIQNRSVGRTLTLPFPSVFSVFTILETAPSE
jgi:hypothetical protein